MQELQTFLQKKKGQDTVESNRRTKRSRKKRAAMLSIAAVGVIPFLAPPVGTDPSVFALAAVANSIDKLFGGEEPAVEDALIAAVAAENEEAANVTKAQMADSTKKNVFTDFCKVAAEYTTQTWNGIARTARGNIWTDMEDELQLLRISGEDGLSDGDVLVNAGEAQGASREFGRMLAADAGLVNQVAAGSTAGAVKPAVEGKAADGTGNQTAGKAADGTAGGADRIAVNGNGTAGKADKAAGSGTTGKADKTAGSGSTGEADKAAGSETTGKTDKTAGSGNADQATASASTDKVDGAATNGTTGKPDKTAATETVAGADKLQLPTDIPSALSMEYNAGYTALKLSSEQLTVLETIVEAEAGDEDAYGKILVANVVLNRVLDEEFPDTVKGVVFQNNGKTYQFSPVRKGGRYYTVKVSKHTKAAVARALAGEDYSDGALYFFARRYTSAKKANWFDTSLRKIVEYGCHEFFGNK